MRTLCSAVLMLQVVVIGLAIPVAVTLTDVDRSAVFWTGGLLILTAVVATATLGNPAGLVLGSAVQVVCVLAGFVLPVMFFVGGLFAVLWVAAVRFGRKGDAARAAHDAR